MIISSVIGHPFGWGDVLLLSLLGFLLGLATKIGPRMKFFDIAAAQRPELFRPNRLPLLPRSLLAAFALPVIELLRHCNTPFFGQHSIYAGCMVGSAVSSAAWLVSLSSLLSVDDQRKRREITEFLSIPNSRVPSGPRLNISPQWLQIWNLLKFAAFIALTVFALQMFFS